MQSICQGLKKELLFAFSSVFEWIVSVNFFQLKEERNFSIEDIDFVVDDYEGDGTYQVINGEYRKID